MIEVFDLVYPELKWLKNRGYNVWYDNRQEGYLHVRPKENTMKDVIVIGGAPGSGKTTIARMIASKLGSLHLDFDWLRAKLDVTDVQALITDYDYLPEDSDLHLVQSALRLAAHIVYKEPTQLGPQLIGRLLSAESAPVQQLLTRTRHTQNPPWLESLRPTLSQAGGPLLRTLTGHDNGLFAVAVSADGRHVVSASVDKTVKVWNPQTYNVLVNFDQNDDAVFSVAFAPGENMIVSGSADNAVRSWRIAESRGTSGRIETRGSLVRVYNGHQGAVYTVDCGRRRNRVIIVSGGADRSVIVWALRSGNRLATFEQPTDEVYAVDLSPDSRFVAAGWRDGRVRIWDLASRELIAELLEE